MESRVIRASFSRNRWRVSLAESLVPRTTRAWFLGRDGRIAGWGRSGGLTAGASFVFLPGRFIRLHGLSSFILERHTHGCDLCGNRIPRLPGEVRSYIMDAASLPDPGGRI